MVNRSAFVTFNWTFFNVTVAKTIALYITVAMYCRLFRVSDSGSDPLLVD